MGIFFAFLAAVLASVSNFSMRRSIDVGGSSKAYLVVQLTFSLIVVILFNPVRTRAYGVNNPSIILGLIGGVIFGLLMWGLGKTLEKGPPGLSFAVLNTSSVTPGIVMALLFGPLLGHPYTFYNALGSLFVVIGLFWAGSTCEKSPNKVSWVIYAFFIFVMHALFFVFLQWWAMILKPDLPDSLFIPLHIESLNSQWFMPSVVFVGALMQWVIYIVKQPRFPQRSEMYYGILGGVTNGGCIFFLILAPQVASSWENAMIFPVFSVSIILICNAWSKIFYNELVNWWANMLCVGGLLIGTITVV